MKVIYSRKGHEILVDDEDYEELNRYVWSISRAGYAFRNIKKPGTFRKKRCILMHRLVMGLEPGDPREVDHRYHKKLDNRKSQLRVCTSHQNHLNTPLRSDNTSGFKGVSLVAKTGMWRAVIVVRGKQKALGMYSTAELAFAAYCAAAAEIHGEFASFCCATPLAPTTA